MDWTPGTDIGKILRDLSEMYDDQSRLNINLLRLLVEPLLILLVGGLMMLLVMCLFLPMVSLVTSIY